MHASLDARGSYLPRKTAVFQPRYCQYPWIRITLRFGVFCAEEGIVREDYPSLFLCEEEEEETVVSASRLFDLHLHGDGPFSLHVSWAPSSLFRWNRIAACSWRVLDFRRSRARSPFAPHVAACFPEGFFITLPVATSPTFEIFVSGWDFSRVSSSSLMTPSPPS